MNQTDSFITSVIVVRAACIEKLLRPLPDKRMARLIMELVGSRSFPLATANGKWSRLRRLKNDVPQESVLAHLLLNICTLSTPLSTTRCELLLEACVQACSQVFKFGGQLIFLGGKIFVFIICLNNIF